MGFRGVLEGAEGLGLVFRGLEGLDFFFWFVTGVLGRQETG